MNIKFEKSLCKMDHIGFGVFINNLVPIYDTNRRIIVSLLFWKWAFNITIIRNLLKEE